MEGKGRRSKRPQVALKLLLSSNKAYGHTFDQWPKLVPCLQYFYSVFAVKMSLFLWCVTLVEIRSSHITWIKHYLGDQISFKYSRTRKKWEVFWWELRFTWSLAAGLVPACFQLDFWLTDYWGFCGPVQSFLFIQTFLTGWWRLLSLDIELQNSSWWWFVTVVNPDPWPKNFKSSRLKVYSWIKCHPPGSKLQSVEIKIKFLSADLKEQKTKLINLTIFL